MVIKWKYKKLWMKNCYVTSQAKDQSAPWRGRGRGRGRRGMGEDCLSHSKMLETNSHFLQQKREQGRCVEAGDARWRPGVGEEHA